jgi:tRNA(Ile)-lysidine synthase
VALRPRLRLLRRDRAGGGSATTALVAATAVSARQRADEDASVATDLAEHVSLRLEGFCVLTDGIAERSLAAVVQAMAGAPYPPPANAVAALAATLRPATLAGVQVLAAGRLGPGFLVVREEAAMAPPVPARPGAVWDGRFRLGAAARVQPGATFGALGADAARLRGISSLPSAVLRTLPALRLGDALLAVPHLLYPDPEACACYPVLFAPPRAAAAAPFSAASGAPNAFGDA